MINKKIAIFLPSLNGGGAEKVMLNVARGLSGLGLDVHLVLAMAKGEYIDQIPRKVNLVDLKSRRTILSLPSLIQYLRKERPRILLSGVEHANIIALCARRLALVKTKNVITIHTNLQYSTRQSDRKLNIIPTLIRCTYPLADEIIAVSRGVAEDFALFANMARERVRVIYNPVITPEIYELAQQPIDHPWFSDEGGKIILSIGRLSDQKDFTTLIKSFVHVLREKKARLLILGEGDQRPYLENLINESGLSTVVSMPGFAKNPYPYLINASVLVLSSRAEGLPTVLIEALALGTPIVSSDCRSGPNEILEGGKWGRLVPVEDEQEMAKAIIAALESKRSVSPESTSRFTLEETIGQYMKVFKGEKEGGI